MQGKERAVILVVLLVVLLAYAASLVARFYSGGLEFDAFKGEMGFLLLFLSGLLVKLPPSTAEAEANAPTQVGRMDVDAEELNVDTPEKS